MSNSRPLQHAGRQACHLKIAMKSSSSAKACGQHLSAEAAGRPAAAGRALAAPAAMPCLSLLHGRHCSAHLANRCLPALPAHAAQPCCYCSLIKAGCRARLQALQGGVYVHRCSLWCACPHHLLRHAVAGSSCVRCLPHQPLQLQAQPLPFVWHPQSLQSTHAQMSGPVAANTLWGQIM